LICTKKGTIAFVSERHFISLTKAGNAAPMQGVILLRHCRA
jgi:hypothetical protein